MRLKQAYKFLKKKGIGQQFIIDHLDRKGIKPPRSKRYSRLQLTRMINEGSVYNADAAQEIIRLAKSYKENKELI